MSAWSSRTTRCSRISPSRPTSASASRAASVRAASLSSSRSSGWTASATVTRTSSPAGSSSASRSLGARAGAELVLLDEPWSNVDPVPARLAPRGGGGDHPTARRHRPARDPRSRGGVLARRSDRAHARRHGRPGGNAGGALLRSRVTLGGGVRRRRERASGSRGRRARPNAIGAFPANGASRRTDARVLVRPELLELEPDDAGAAEVVAREFRGHDVFYRVLLDGGRARLAPAVHRGRRPRLARVDPRARGPRARSRLSLRSIRCKVCLTLRLW